MRTHVASSGVAERLPAMCGSETFATAVSSTSMNVASITEIAMSHGLKRGTHSTGASARRRGRLRVGPSFSFHMNHITIRERECEISPRDPEAAGRRPPADRPEGARAGAAFRRRAGCRPAPVRPQGLPADGHGRDRAGLGAGSGHALPAVPVQGGDPPGPARGADGRADRARARGRRRGAGGPRPAAARRGDPPGVRARERRHPPPLSLGLDRLRHANPPAVRRPDRRALRALRRWC